MIRLFRRLNVKATDTQAGLALGMAAVGMGLMLWAIVWQSNVIAYQQGLIRWMWDAKFGG